MFKRTKTGLDNKQAIRRGIGFSFSLKMSLSIGILAEAYEDTLIGVDSMVRRIPITMLQRD